MKRVICSIIGGVVGSMAGDAIADKYLQEDSLENDSLNFAADKVLDIFK